MGLRSSQSWIDDPKHLVFRLARYKFVAKMLEGREHVLEIGCGDAFGTRIVQAEVGKLTAIDFDSLFVDDVKQRMNPRWPFDVYVHDLLDEPVTGDHDAAFALDVLEHIDPAEERIFLRNAFSSIHPHGVAINPGFDVFDRIRVIDAEVIFGHVAEMGRQYGIFEAAKRMVGRQWFRVINV